MLPKNILLSSSGLKISTLGMETVKSSEIPVRAIGWMSEFDSRQGPFFSSPRCPDQL
jgi:hypothetical protein